MKKNIALTIIITAATLHARYNLSAQEVPPSIYGEIQKRSIFSPLPLNEVRPKGWLLRQAELASKGLSGDLQLLENNVWRHSASTRKKSGSRAWWSYEQQAYYVDGVTCLAHVLGDPKLLNSCAKDL